MNKKVGKIISHARLKNKLTQEELAKKLDVSSSMISYWETGKGEPDNDIIDKLCNTLKINKKKFNEKPSYELITKDKQSKFSVFVQKAIKGVITYMLVTILLATGYVLVHNAVSNDMYYKTYGKILSTHDKKIIKEADKNLETIKNSNGILDEKAKEEKKAMIKILEAYSYKLNNYKGYNGKNNYEYMLYLSNELGIYNFNIYCPTHRINDINNEKCDLKKSDIYSYPVKSLFVLYGMDKKINNISDKEYNPSERFPYLHSNYRTIASATVNSEVLSAYFPDLHINNYYRDYYVGVYYWYNPSMKIDEFYLELTKAVMKVGDIHE